MKKRLESELISIAHRILKLKNKSDVDQLYKETQKLYETLAVLKFYQDNFESVKSEVSEEDLEEKLQVVPDEAPAPEAVEEKQAGVAETVAEAEPEVVQEPEIEIKEEETEPETETKEEEPEAEPEMETEAEVKEEEIPAEDDTIQPEAVAEVAAALTEEEIVADAKPAFEPIFELEVEEEEEEIAPAETASEVSPEEKPVKLEDFLGNDYKDPVFVKPNEVSLFPSDTTAAEEVKQTTEEEPKREETPAQPVTPNPSTAKTIAIGLNDRIGFVQHLFNDSNEDFNRVLSQLNTFNTFDEAKAFINDMVIPDYNYWVGEEEYIERFMAIVEKKFQ